MTALRDAITGYHTSRVRSSWEPSCISLAHLYAYIDGFISNSSRVFVVVVNL
jgi:hypothetical protein